MADLADHADLRIERETAARLRAIRAAARGPAQPPPSRTCRECGEPISARRLAVQPAASRCRACQAGAERQP